MLNLIALILLLLALLASILLKTYYLIPLKELKRRARHAEPNAKVLYRAASYGSSLKLFLWILIILTISGSFVFIAQMEAPFIVFIMEVVIVAGFLFLIFTEHVSSWMKQITVWLTPSVAWILSYLHPGLDSIVGFVHKYTHITVHTGLYEREDLMELIERQKSQPDSRLSIEELELLAHVLTFGDKTVADCMVPRKVVKTISDDESIGPVVIRELHDSGYSRFPVYKDKADNFVGTLYLRDLVELKHTGLVRDVMDKHVYYVHEEYSLEQVLHAFLVTKHHMFVAVNSFEEFVGVITIEDLIQQILGFKIVDEFDHYDD